MIQTIHQQLAAACGCIGRAILSSVNAPMQWQRSLDDPTPVEGPEAHTLSVEFSVHGDAGEVVDAIQLDGDTWRTMESEGLIDLHDLAQAVGDGTALRDALCEQVDAFTNTYVHCGETWNDDWSCACNDRCPVCNAEIEPLHSERIRALEEGDDGVYRLLEGEDAMPECATH